MFESLRAIGLLPPKRVPQVEERASQITPWGPWGDSYGTTAGITVSTNTATQLLTVYGCVQLIADTIATLPLKVYRAQGESQIPVPSPPWMEQPNEYSSMIDFITQTLWSLLLDGNAYWAYGLSNAFGTNYLTILDPCQVNVRAEESASYADPRPEVIYEINGERFRGNMLHIRGIMRPGALKGVSPVEAARQGIGIGLAADQYAGAFLANSSLPSGIITTDADLTPDQTTDLRREWDKAHRGSNRAGALGVLDNGAKFQQVSITPEQAQFLESRNYQAAQIAGQMFLLDPTMLGITVNSNSLTYANLEQRGIHLVQFTLMRWIVRIERALSHLLPRPQYAKFNVAAIERADLKTRYEAHRIALGPTKAFETVDEVRGFEELGPTPDELKNQTPAPAQQPSQNFQPQPVSQNGHNGVRV